MPNSFNRTEVSLTLFNRREVVLASDTLLKKMYMMGFAQSVIDAGHQAHSRIRLDPGDWDL